VAAYCPLRFPKLATVSGSIARSPSSPPDAPRVKLPKRYLLSSSGKPPLRDFVDGAASSSACAAGGLPKTRGTPHIMAARLRGQQRWRGMLWSPRYSAGLPHTRLLWKGTSAVAVKSKGQSD